MPAILTYALLGLGLIAVLAVLRVCVLIGRAEDAANTARDGSTPTGGDTSIVIGHLIVNIHPTSQRTTRSGVVPAAVLRTLPGTVGPAVRSATRAALPAPRSGSVWQPEVRR